MERRKKSIVTLVNVCVDSLSDNLSEQRVNTPTPNLQRAYRKTKHVFAGHVK